MASNDDDLDGLYKRTDRECPEDMICESCGKVSEELTYYDNEIWGPAGYLCWDCISNTEMEL